MTHTDAGQPVKGQTAFIVDEVGGTWAWPAKKDADEFAESERKAQAHEVVQFEVTVPRDGMTWEDVADYACQVGPEGTV
jgi:hypothetical protein